MESAETTWDGRPEGGLTAIEPSFEDFFELEQERLVRILWMVTGSLQEAEDIVQDAFLRVWERWHKVSAMESPTGYLRQALSAEGPHNFAVHRTGRSRCSRAGR